MKKIVVLGGSFGGLTAALEIKRLLGGGDDVTLISADKNFVFLPSLPWLIMGSRRAEDITLDVARILGPREIGFLHETVTGVKPDGQKVATHRGEYFYDYLVISTGPYLACEEIPGLGPKRGYTPLHHHFGLCPEKQGCLAQAAQRTGPRGNRLDPDGQLLRTLLRTCL